VSCASLPDPNPRLAANVFGQASDARRLAPYCQGTHWSLILSRGEPHAGQDTEFVAPRNYITDNVLP